jgi:hypothetical protein
MDQDIFGNIRDSPQTLFWTLSGDCLEAHRLSKPVMPKKPSKYVPLLGESAHRLPTFCAARGTSTSASGYHQQQFSSSCPQHEQRQRDTRRRRAGGHPYRHQCGAPWRTATIVPRASNAARLVTEARVIPRPDLFFPSKSSGTGLNSSSEIREFDGLNQRGSRVSPVGDEIDR